MGRITELLNKKKSGDITEAEQKELDTLLVEAKAADEGEGNGAGDSTADDEDQAVDELATKLADAATVRLEKNLERVLKGIEDKNSPRIETPSGVKFIVDPKLGKKSIDELAEIKIALPGREDKQVKEVSLKTVHFFSALLTNDVQKLQVLVEGTGSRGGFLVPEEFANLIVEDLRDLVVMRQLADVINVTSDTLHLPTLAGRPNAQWRSEGATKATSTVDFGELVLTPYSLAAIVGLSNELVADAQLGVSGSVINYIARVMEQSLAEKEDKAFWTGSGSGQPTGVTTYSFRTVDAGAGSSDSARADALIAAYIRTPQAYRNRAVWVLNAQTMENIHQAKDSQGNYLLNRLADAPLATIKGRPVYEQNDLPGGTAFFGDFSYYKIADREGVSVRVSDEATVASQSAFERNLTFVRVEKRVDGELALANAITKVTGLGTP